MIKRHLKRLTAPRSWKIKRKGITFVTRPNSGMHGKTNSTSINVLMRDVLKQAKTTRDVKMVINSREILVDKKEIKDHRFQVGVMDLVEIPKTNNCFRVMLDKKGNICVVEIKQDEATLKPCKIIDKKVMKKGKIQLNLNDGKNILVNKDIYKTGDTLLLSLPKNEIKQHLKFEKGVYVYLSRGKHKGDSGIIEDVKDGIIKIKPKSGKSFETSKRFAFVVGKEKEMITLPS
jgi:small subunit ribosomal protein S4e